MHCGCRPLVCGQSLSTKHFGLSAVNRRLFCFKNQVEKAQQEGQSSQDTADTLTGPPYAFPAGLQDSWSERPGGMTKVALAGFQHSEEFSPYSDISRRPAGPDALACPTVQVFPPPFGHCPATNALIVDCCGDQHQQALQLSSQANFESPPLTPPLQVLQARR